jgi:3-oxoacyl-[acyl-carrier protein] reductase
MSQELNGKKIFVTGGSRGIGAAIVKVLASRGATVAFTYASKADDAAKVLSQLPGSGHMHFSMDLKDEESIKRVCDKVDQQFGGLDGLVNNAGITKDGLMLRMRSEDFSSVIDTNLKGTFLVTRELLKGFLKARKGSIVNITSVIGQTGNSGQANYAASKGGIEAMTKSIAVEVASRGIRANCVAPGFIATEMTANLADTVKSSILESIPMGRIAEPDEVAYAVAFLLSDDSRYVTGQTLSVNGGMYRG